MDRVAVFGIGSTQFRYAAATSDGTIRTSIAVEPTRPNRLAEQIAAAVEELHADTPIDAVSIATAGLVDSRVHSGPGADSAVIRAFDTPSGETIDRIDVGAAVRPVVDVPIVLENDCNAAALGEYHFGGGDDVTTLVHLTFGTGIGGGVVEDGRLLRGEDGQAGEFGLLSIAPDSPLESTGVRGAWEAHCSGRGLANFAAHRAQTYPSADRRAFVADAAAGRVDAPDVFEAAANGNDFARECLDRVATLNAIGVAAVCNAVNPGLITLGGGVALNNAEWIVRTIEAELSTYLFVDPPALSITDLGDDIGLYGALATAIKAGIVTAPDRTARSSSYSGPSGQ